MKGIFPAFMQFEKYKAYYGRLAFAVSVGEGKTVPMELQAVVLAN